MENKRFISRLLSNIESRPTSHNIGLKQVLLANDETISDITQIAVTTLRRGEIVGSHIHNSMDEHYLFQSGVGCMIVNDEVVECKEGLFLLIPSGTQHGMRAETEMKFITIGISLEQ